MMCNGLTNLAVGPHALQRPETGLDHGVGHSICRCAQTPLVLMRVEAHIALAYVASGRACQSGAAYGGMTLRIF